MRRHRAGNHRQYLFVLPAALAVLAASCSSGPSRTAATSPGRGRSTTSVSRRGHVPSTTTTTLPVKPLVWTSCGAPFQCAKLTAPLDYAHPSAATIKLALVRLPASDPAHRVGSLLVNPGGPGASGVDFVEQQPTLFSANLRAHFDIVGFDPRGVGRSDPVRCETAAGLTNYIDVNPAPTNAAGVQNLVTTNRTFAQGCESMSGKALLAHVGTIDAARDMDRIRAALGEPKLTYLGFSYGTFLGATYAELFPHRVRAMTLDGALDPSLGTEASDIQQAKGFEQDLSDFLANCDSTPGCPLDQAGGSRATFDRALAVIRSGKRLPGPAGSGRTLGPGEGYLGIVAGLYSSTTWPYLAQAVAQVLTGQGALLLDLSDSYTMRRPDGTYQNTLEANAAVNCVDRPSPSSLATYKADAASFEAQAPDFGELEAYGPLACAYWPVPPTDQPHPITAKGAPPIVVVGTTADPATPYAGAVALAHQLSSGVLVTHVGVGHTAYVDSSCVRGIVDAYLINLTVPSSGVVCKG